MSHNDAIQPYNDDDDQIPYPADDNDDATGSPPETSSPAASNGTTALSTVAHSQVVQQPQPGFDARQLALIKSTLAPGISDDQLALFALVVQRTGLDPFQRQIYAVLRNAKEKVNGKEAWVKRMTIQTGIDGYLAIAERTGELAGIDDIAFDTEEGQHPNWARATVWRWSRNGQRVPFTFTARYREYAQLKDEYKDGQKTGRKTVADMWERMPWTMLGKCALARALREGFPAHLSGIYTGEEMMQADTPLLTGEIVESEPAASAPKTTMPSLTSTHTPPAAAPSAAKSTTRSISSAAAFNPLGDTPFRKRLTNLGIRAVAEVEEFVEEAKKRHPDMGLREACFAHLTFLETPPETPEDYDLAQLPMAKVAMRP